MGVIKILVRDVINGSAKKRLLEVYEAPKQSNLQGWVQAVRKPTKEGTPKYAGFSKSVSTHDRYTRTHNIMTNRTSHCIIFFFFSHGVR